MMRTLLHVLALCFVAVTAFQAYRVNYETLAAAEKVEALQAEIADARQAIDVLRAEWAWRNAPDRLRALVATHAEALELGPVRTRHHAGVETVAFPPPPPLTPPAPVPAVPAEAAAVVSDATAPAAPVEDVAALDDRPVTVAGVLAPGIPLPTPRPARD